MSTSSSSTSSSSANLQTSSIYRLTGTNLYSGLDTDSIIKALVSNTQSRIDKQGQLEQIAEWKQSLYRGVTTDMQDFENTYFSYTSDTNLLSPTFFTASDITSSSSVVSATGNTTNAQNLVINSISQLATKASYISSQKASDEAITSGTIQSSWTDSTVGGKSLVVSYNGTDYTLTLNSSVQLDSANMSASAGTELQKIVDGLNDQIGANSSLSGNVSFSLGADNNLVLTATNSSNTVGVKAYTTSTDTTTGAAFLSALGLTAGSATGSVTGSAMDTDVTTSGLFNKAVSSSSYLKFTLGSSTDEYTVTLGSNLTLTEAGGTDHSDDLSSIQSALQSQINANSELNGKINVSVVGGAIQLSTTDGETLSVSGGSSNLLNGLGLSGASGTTVTGSALNYSDLFQNSLGDTLSGNTLTFSLDGVSKSVTFDANEESSYSSAAGIASYLQGKLDNIYGNGKVNVSLTGGKLSFTTTDTTSVLSISSSSGSDVLDDYGALRINSGDSNRLVTTKTLSELAGDMSNPPTADADGNYSITVNGKSFSFSGDTELSDVISQINSDDDAGVTISYSQTTDTFSITADDTGSQGKVDFSGSLATALFGSSGTTTPGSDLEMNVTINGQTSDITRSSNTTTLDGVTLTATGTTTTPVSFSANTNVDDLATKIVDFVNAYNKIIDEVNNLTTESKNTDEDYAPLTDAQKAEMTSDEIDKWNTEAQKGLLKNDNVLNGILDDMRSAMTSMVESAGTSLSALGISTQAYDYTSGGQLVVDTSALKAKLASDPDVVTKLFTDTDGVSQKVKSAIDKYVGTFGGNGILVMQAGTANGTSDTSFLTKQITQYKSTISDLKTQLQTEEDRYWNKFTQMEQALSILNSQSTYLSNFSSNSSSSSSS